MELELRHGERRKFTRKFKLEAVRLIKVRGLSYVQASQDLNVHTSQLRDWVKKFSNDPEHAFPGNGQMKQLEITRLKREVAKLKAERDILKKPRPTSRRNRREVLLHCEAPGDLGRGLDVRGARCLAGGGFYGWLTRPRSQRSRDDEELAARVRA
jgi:transposase